MTTNVVTVNMYTTALLKPHIKLELDKETRTRAERKRICGKGSRDLTLNMHAGSRTIRPMFNLDLNRFKTLFSSKRPK